MRRVLNEPLHLVISQPFRVDHERLTIYQVSMIGVTRVDGMSSSRSTGTEYRPNADAVSVGTEANVRRNITVEWVRGRVLGISWRPSSDRHDPGPSRCDDIPLPATTSISRAEHCSEDFFIAQGRQLMVSGSNRVSWGTRSNHKTVTSPPYKDGCQPMNQARSVCFPSNLYQIACRLRYSAHARVTSVNVDSSDQ